MALNIHSLYRKDITGEEGRDKMSPSAYSPGIFLWGNTTTAPLYPAILRAALREFKRETFLLMAIFVSVSGIYVCKYEQKGDFH